MKKIGLSVLALILIAGIVYAGYFFFCDKRDYLTVCLDKVKEEIREESLLNVNIIEARRVNGVYHCFGTCSSKTSNYYFSCSATSKNNVDVEIRYEVEEPEMVDQYKRIQKKIKEAEEKQSKVEE